MPPAIFDFKAIRHALNRLTGAAPSGERFSALEPGVQPKNKGPGHDFDRDWGTCTVCKFTRIEMEDGFCALDKCPGPITVPTMVLKNRTAENWKHPDGSMWVRDIWPKLIEQYEQAAYDEACFRAWLAGGANAQMPEKLKPIVTYDADGNATVRRSATTAADLVNSALAQSLANNKLTAAARVLQDRDAYMRLTPGFQTEGIGRIPDNEPASAPWFLLPFDPSMYPTERFAEYHEAFKEVEGDFDTNELRLCGRAEMERRAAKLFNAIPLPGEDPMFAEVEPAPNYSNELDGCNDLNEAALEKAFVLMKQWRLEPHRGNPIPPTNCCGNPDCETCNDGRRRGVYVERHS